MAGTIKREPVFTYITRLVEQVSEAVVVQGAEAAEGGGRQQVQGQPHFGEALPAAAPAGEGRLQRGLPGALYPLTPVSLKRE